MLKLPRDYHLSYCGTMSNVLLSYVFNLLLIWVNGDQPPGWQVNATSDSADPRSPIGKVPPLPPPAMGVGPPSGYRPQHSYSHIIPWQKSTVDNKNSMVMAEDYGAEDDSQCTVSCNKEEFFCQISCICIDMKKRCNEVVDCKESEDEAGCTAACNELENRTLCHNSDYCISRDWLCDGDDDCGDFSDESHCTGTGNCTQDEFTCENGLCIHKQWVCDGDNDCRDSSDEMNCTKAKCRDNQFTCNDGNCIALHWRCDREPDCLDKSDESETCPIDLITCREHEYQCVNKKCILKEFKCDGDNDCGDWTDEEDTCPSMPGICSAREYKCNDGKCIPERWRCDDQRDCTDGDDEVNCDVAKRNCSHDEHQCKDKKCILNTWLCDGVHDCSDGEDEMNCTVNCEIDQYTCKSQEHLISNAFRNCVNKKHVCDGMKDCPKGDDEENCPIKRKCRDGEKCKGYCVTKHDGEDGCECGLGYLLDPTDGFSCQDIDECRYEQDPACSQTCSNTIGSFKCGCMTGYVLRPDGRSCKAIGESPSLLFSNRIGIRQVWLTGDNYMPVIKGLHNAVALDYHYEKKLLFWTENNLKVIRVAEMNNNNLSDVIRWGLETPAGVAVDWIHNLLFWTDSGTRRVQVANLDGSLRAVLAASDLDKPRAIVVHPGDCLIFWTDWGPNPKIERADMDGSQRKSIIEDRIYWPNGLTIDYTESRIYWADAKLHVIEKATFDGRDRKIIKNKGLPHPFALTIFEDAIYWTDWHTKSISTINKKTGMGIQSVHAELRVPMDIHSYHPLRQPSYRNSCGNRNGGCSHLCLPNSRGYSCRCPVGFNLGSDERTCHDTPNELLLYARKKDIRLKQLYPKKPMDSLDMVIPVDNIKSAVALEWDYKTNSIFWTDIEKYTINRAYLNGSNHVVIVSSNLITPVGLSYDWVTDKIYWTDSGNNRIEVANSDGTMRTTLVWEKLAKPRDIIVEPRDGVMYWSDWGESPCIEKADMDGLNRKLLISGKMTCPNGLALDYKAKRIYWTDGKTKTIEYAYFDGTGRTVLIEALPYPFGLDLYGEEIFWSDFETHSIQAANKITAKERRTLGAGAPELRDVKVFHSDRRNIGHHECLVKNGDCSHICIINPKGRTCSCPTGISLKADRITCESAPANFLLFSHRIDIRFVSLDKPYLIDVVLPLPPIKHSLGLDFDKSTGLLYWTDTAERKILRANLTGGQNETVIGKNLHTVDGVAIDSSGRKIYWTDGGRNSIEVAELDGSNRKVLVWTGLDSPRTIALYYEKGIMFWTDWGSAAKIERAAMDGTKRKVIIDQNIKWPNGLAVDRLKDQIYWSDAQSHTIESSNFDGRDRRIIMENVPYPYGIAVAGQHMYWTDWKSESLQRADKETGSDILVIRKNLDGLMNVRAVQGNERIPPNACWDNNGLCSHLCLRNSMNSFSCACPTGLLFEEGQEINRKCKRHPDNFLMFATAGSVEYISFDTPEMSDVTMPITDVQHSIAVDFHWDNRLIFFSDVNRNVIRSVNMSNMSESKVVIHDRIDKPNGLGVDWIASNIYWTDNKYKVLEVARLDGTSRKTLITGLAEPRALALFPAKGYLYWSDWGKNPYIERAYLDGSSRKTIVNKDIGFPNGLAIDYRQRKLYWVDALKDRIDVANLDGTHRMLLTHGAMRPFGLTMFNDYIYWTDWNQKSVMRANKTTGKNVTVIQTDLEMAMEIKMVSVERQHGWNPCKEENGGCSHLCLFRKHNYICACPDEPDSKPCSADPTARVDMKMPPHYPSFYDYADDETDTFKMPRPKTGPSSNFSLWVIVAITAAMIFVAVLTAAYYYMRREADGGRGELKESFRNSEGRFSFHNPNYAAGSSVAGDPERRNRFQGIFKYDKSDEKVTNVYIPEGTSLLPPPPPPPHQDLTLHRSTRDNFEPVTLHSYA